MKYVGMLCAWIIGGIVVGLTARYFPLAFPLMIVIATIVLGIAYAFYIWKENRNE